MTRWGNFWLTFVATVLSAVAVASPAAAAGVTHQPLGIVAQGKAFGVPFEGPCGLALDSDGRLYVSDYRRKAIEVFSPGFVGEIDMGEGENSFCDLAVDSAGNLYANEFHGRVVKYVPGSFPFLTPAYGPPLSVDAERATGVAVDPLTDRVYVAHRAHIAAYEADGSPVLDGGEPLRIGLGAIEDGYGLAVSAFPATQGWVYIADAADGTVKAFDPAADPDSPALAIDGTEVPGAGFSDLTDATLAVDDANGHLFVVDNLQPGEERPAAAIDEFGPGGEYVGQISHWLEPPEDLADTWIVDATPTGIAVGPDGRIYVTSDPEAVFNSGSQAWEAGRVYAFGAAVPARRLTVSRAGAGAGRVSSALGGIGCGRVCSLEYRQGTTITLTAAPKPASSFTGWSVDGDPGACPGRGACTVTLEADSEVVAEFAPVPQRTLTVTKEGAGTVTGVPAGIACGQTCSASYDQGSVVRLSAEAAPGSHFAGWSGAGCAGLGECAVSLATDAAVQARFEPLPPPAVLAARETATLAVSVTGSGAGAIGSDPAGIDCGTPCAGSYRPGTRVTLTARADAGSRFAGWSGCDGTEANRCTVTLGASRTVGAAFEEAAPLEVRGATVKGARATLKVVVPGPGTLSAGGKKLRSASVKARRAGTVGLTLALGKAGLGALRAKGRLSLTARVSFAPADGGEPTTATRKLTFEGNPKDKARSRSGKEHRR